MFNPNPSAVAPFLAWAFLAPIPPIGVKPSQAMPSQLNANQLKVIAFNPNPSAVACSWLGPFRLYFFLSVSSQAKPSQAKPSQAQLIQYQSIQSDCVQSESNINWIRLQLPMEAWTIPIGIYCNSAPTVRYFNCLQPVSSFIFDPV